MLTLVALLAFVATCVVVWAALAASPRDVVMVTSVWAVCAMLVSARLVLPGTGAVGTPANAVALGCLLWWVVGVLVPTLGLDRSPNPVRYAVFAFFCVVLLSYGLAAQRILTPLERSGGDRALIATAAVCGLALLACDGLETVSRVEVLLKRLVRLAVVVAVIGVLQFGWQVDAVSWIRPPLLEENAAILTGQLRQDFLRPSSTALHPIEYSVVLAAVLPFALVLATRSRGGRAWGWWVSVLVLVTGGMISVSRSAVLAMVVVGLVMAAGWTWSRRVQVSVLAAGFVLALGTLVPGLLGTFRAMFVDAGDDPSVQARLADQRAVSTYLSERPWTGRGLGTFNVEQYFFLDNQYFGTAIESGLLGLLALCSFLAVGLVVSWRVSRSPDALVADLGRALLAAIAVCGTGMFTFDLLAYPMVTGIWFVCTGVAGFLWRLERSRPPVEGTRAGGVARVAADPGGPAGPQRPVDPVATP